MEKTKQYKIEGAILDIPMHWDEHSQKYLEDYSLLIENPAYTQEGRPILLTIEDACRYSEPADDDPSSIDCGSCRYYRQISGTLLGVCHNGKMRSGPEPAQSETSVKKEETT